MKNLILRNTPEIADMFELRDIESVDGKNTYELFCENGKIVLCGDCKISQAMAYYAYLKKYCGVNISHCGNREFSVSSAPLFEGKITKVLYDEVHVELNYGFDGIIPASELVLDKNEEIADRYTVGNEISAEITKIQRKDGTIYLSVKKAVVEEARKELKAATGNIRRMIALL